MEIIRIKEVKEREPVPGYKVRFVHSENVTIAYWDIKRGYSLPEHSHFHEQIANVLEGDFQFTIDGKTFIAKPGTVVIIPSNARHSGYALTDCFLIDIFHPVREDYK